MVVEKVRAFCPDVVDAAEKAGVDVERIARQLFEEYKGRYKERTILTRIRAELRRQIQAKSATKVKGIIAGSRDRFGKNYPIRLAVVRSSGEHLEVSTWSYEHVKAGNSTAEVPVPSIAELSVQKDEQYDSYQLLSIEKFKPLTSEEAVEKLLQVAKRPSELDYSDKKRVVVVKGKIQTVHPATRFEEGKATGTYPVLTVDARSEPNQHPTMQIWLEPDGEVRCRLLLERPRYAKPYYAIEDFVAVCEDAMKLGDHAEQCKYVQDFIEGRNVIAVGVVLQYNPIRRDDGSPVTYVDIGVAGLYEYESAEPVEAEPIKEKEKVDVFGEFFEQAMEKLSGHWYPVDPEKLDKIAQGNVLDQPPTMTQAGRDTELDGVRAHAIIGETSDGETAGVAVCADGSVRAACTCEQQYCRHVCSVWMPAGRNHYAKVKEKVKEQKAEAEPDIERIKNLIRAYCRALNLSISNIDEGIAEKMGLTVPIGVIREAIRQLREEENAES